MRAAKARSRQVPYVAQILAQRMSSPALNLEPIQPSVFVEPDVWWDSIIRQVLVPGRSGTLSGCGEEWLADRVQVKELAWRAYTQQHDLVGIAQTVPILDGVGLVFAQITWLRINQPSASNAIARRCGPSSRLFFGAPWLSWPE